MNLHPALWFIPLTVASILLCAEVATAQPEYSVFAIFPDSAAAAHLAVPSQLTLLRDFRSWESNSHWSTGVHEDAVFQAQLRHESTRERSWVLGVGQGGQIYSLVTPWGETLPPQSSENPWNDEVWQATALSTGLLGHDEALHGNANAFIHQSGMYVVPKDHPEVAKPFYSPLLAASFDPADRSYSVLSWGQIPTPSINRAQVLFYARYRDLGAGIIELTYVVHNFGPDVIDDLAVPWGGVRTSVFPEQVLGRPGEGYDYFTPFNYGQPDSNLPLNTTGGWAARVKNAADPHSPALGLVFGVDRHWPEQEALRQAGQPFFINSPSVFGSGDSRHGPRDYSVMAVALRSHLLPGGTMFMRDYLVVGTLDEVAVRATELVDQVDYGTLHFDADQAPLAAVYPKRLPNGQPSLTRVAPGGAAQPLFSTFAVPVEGSRPLFLLEEVATGKHFVTTDPCALCGTEPFENPYPADDPKHAQFSNRTIAEPFDGKTKWVELLGYVLTADGIKPGDANRYEALTEEEQARRLILPATLSQPALMVRMPSE